jgi:nuclease-like protein
MTDDPYFVRGRLSTAVNKAGGGARQKALEARAEARVRTALARVMGVHTDERAWRRGGEGEERVGQLLERLPTGWYAFHDLTVGSRGANLDHLVIGPGGVFVLNTKNLTGNVWVGERVILHNGQGKDFLRDSKRESQIAADRLSRAVGFPVSAVAVLAIFADKMKVKTAPPEVRVVEGASIRRWLERQPAVLASDQAAAIAKAADDPATWLMPQRTVRRRSTAS